jgi:lipoprotein-anchoring transpeptidase ErfK/SrfK
MSGAKLAMLSSIWLAGAGLPAQANILIQIDQSTQRMSVDVDGERLYDWRISTGRPGYDTPDGTFRPNRMDADHFSQEYDNAPMPDAIFFDLHGHAIHGSYDPVGHPAASHGCVRLDPANAAKLFDLVKEEGMANTTVEITGNVKVALRNSKSAARVRAARRKPLPSEPDASWDEDAQ